ncbi:MAG TPA: hypothetical protein VFE58_04850, partial [Tepidisphaeraceae bacterium]|nr:hypothetical protein [Tepidisphaeraceae bacterium]
MSRPYLLYCSALLLLFGFLSYSAILTKSPTFDEPAHICSSYIALHDGDFSVEPDHPPLWKYWAALPLLTTPFNANTNTPIFHRIPFQADTEFPWSVGTLFQTPENNTPFIINSTRFMMLLIALALGATIALFTHHLAGPLAACIATTLFALDPNFLAHASLVKNDVALAATYTALTYTLYLICQHLTPLRLLSLILLTTACVTTKLTGLLAAPLVVAVLLTRAFQSTPWPLRYPLSSILYPLSSRRSRLLLTLTLSALCFLTTYAGIWSVYRFRFNPSPDPAVHYDTQQFLTRAAKGDLLATLHRNYATAAEFNAWKP